MIAVNTKMLDVLRRQLNSGYANRTDVATQEAALAQAVSLFRSAPNQRKLRAFDPQRAETHF